MKKFMITSIASGLIASVAFTAPVLAWHPQGTIVKKVQNVSTNSSLADANTSAAAVDAKPGDILRYVVEISNSAQPASNNYNDLAFVTLSDTLPVGVELVSNPTQRTVNETFPGVIKPQNKIVKEYQVKVTSTKNGDLIDNKACFTGDSLVKDSPKAGCDNAIVKVKVPPVTPPTTPQPPVVTPPVTPAVLPATGASTNLFGLAAVVAIIGYLGHFVASKRRLN